MNNNKETEFTLLKLLLLCHNVVETIKSIKFTTEMRDPLRVQNRFDRTPAIEYTTGVFFNDFRRFFICRFYNNRVYIRYFQYHGGTFKFFNSAVCKKVQFKRTGSGKLLRCQVGWEYTNFKRKKIVKLEQFWRALSYISWRTFLL